MESDQSTGEPSFDITPFQEFIEYFLEEDKEKAAPSIKSAVYSFTKIQRQQADDEHIYSQFFGQVEKDTESIA